MKIDPRKKDKYMMALLIFVAACLIMAFVAYVFWGFINHL